MEKEMSPRDSLLVIQSMIDKTKHSLSDHSHYFLLWGYAVFFACAIQYYLLSIDHPKHYYAWFVTLLAAVVQVFLIFRDTKREQVSTFVGDATGYLWSGLGISFMVAAIIFVKIGFQYCFPIYILMYALGTFVTGLLLRFRPLLIGGVLCFVIAAVTPYTGYKTQILMCGLSILISYIIPGHLLGMQYNKQKSAL